MTSETAERIVCVAACDGELWVSRARRVDVVCDGNVLRSAQPDSAAFVSELATTANWVYAVLVRSVELAVLPAGQGRLTRLACDLARIPRRSPARIEIVERDVTAGQFPLVVTPRGELGFRFHDGLLAMVDSDGAIREVPVRGWRGRPQSVVASGGEWILASYNEVVRVPLDGGDYTPWLTAAEGHQFGALATSERFVVVSEGTSMFGHSKRPPRGRLKVFTADRQPVSEIETAAGLFVAVVFAGADLAWIRDTHGKHHVEASRALARAQTIGLASATTLATSGDAFLFAVGAELARVPATALRAVTGSVRVEQVFDAIRASPNGHQVSAIGDRVAVTTTTLEGARVTQTLSPAEHEELLGLLRL